MFSVSRLKRNGRGAILLPLLWLKGNQVNFPIAEDNDTLPLPLPRYT
jgi:hypothetical protein